MMGHPSPPDSHSLTVPVLSVVMNAVFVHVKLQVGGCGPHRASHSTSTLSDLERDHTGKTLTNDTV